MYVFPTLVFGGTVGHVMHLTNEPAGFPSDGLTSLVVFFGGYQFKISEGHLFYRGGRNFSMNELFVTSRLQFIAYTMMYIETLGNMSSFK